MSEKIRFGLSNVHIALWNTSSCTYDVPRAIKGAVSVDLKPIEDKFSVNIAGNVKQTISQENKGYDGSITFQIVPSWFYTDVFGETIDENNVLSEIHKSTSTNFALIFQFETDQDGRRFVFYNCKCYRQGISSGTISSKIDIQKDEFDIEVRPRLSDKKIKANTTSETPLEVYNNWFNSVY